MGIPVFVNKTEYTGIETSFTNALRSKFAKSKVAQIVEVNRAPAVIRGEITDIQIIRGGAIDANESGDDFTDNGNSNDELPDNTILTTEYRVLVTVYVKMIGAEANRQLWDGQFRGERTYTAPQARTARLNSANALYNDNARRQIIAEISEDIMAEAHDRISENF